MAAWPASALPAILTLFALLPTSHSANATESHDSPGKVGWYSGPGSRSTTTLLWSCLTTVIACTWTVLHLNVPAPNLSSFGRLDNKLWWMIVTMLFPEITFSKAVVELQRAVEDLVALKRMESRFYGWNVECGSYMQSLHSAFCALERLFPHDNKPIPIPPVVVATTTLSGESSTEEGPIRLDRNKTWTITHSYFANMGGIRRTRVPGTTGRSNSEITSRSNSEITSRSNSETTSRSDLEIRSRSDLETPSRSNSNTSSRWNSDTTGRSDSETSSRSNSETTGTSDSGTIRGIDSWFPTIPITAHSLLDCCDNGNHQPLASLNLSEDDINDKSKADGFTKSLVVIQISWLLVSCVTRAVRHLPLSQLEICTAAFAVLSICTYAANWWKPKGVERAVTISPERFCDYCQTSAAKLGYSFFHRLWRPFSKTLIISPAIGNDYILRSPDDPAFVFSFILAMSTIVFGGIHCLGWQSHFTTRVERVLWLSSSIITATIPLGNLVLTTAMLSLIRRRIQRFFSHLKKKYERLPPDAKWLEEMEEGKKALKWGNLGIVISRDLLKAASSHSPSCSNRHLSDIMYSQDVANHVDHFLRQLQMAYIDYDEIINKSNLFGKLDAMFFSGQLMKLKSSYLNLIAHGPGINIYLGPLPAEKQIFDLNKRSSTFPRLEASKQDLICLFNLALHTYYPNAYEDLPRPDLPEEHQWIYELESGSTSILDFVSCVAQISRGSNTASRCFAIISGLLYIVARLAILALAFATLREQDERLYVDTWTRHLLKIG